MQSTSAFPAAVTTAASSGRSSSPPLPPPCGGVAHRAGKRIRELVDRRPEQQEDCFRSRSFDWRARKATSSHRKPEWCGRTQSQPPPHGRVRERCAFVSILWPGETPEITRGCILDAMVLGASLISYPRFDKVLLVTSDLLEMTEAHGLSLFWDVRVEPQGIDLGAASMRHANRRFKRVFTKLLAWKLDGYARCVLLDGDLIARGCIDDLPYFSTPAAVMKGHEDSKPGTRVTSNLHPQNHRLIGGINAGVIVYEPDKEAFRRMVLSLPDESDMTTAPEQDFLTLHFHRWTELPRKYNFQVEQMLKAGLRAHDSSELKRLVDNCDEVRIWHYSGSFKPHDMIFSGQNVDDFVADWMKEQTKQIKKSWRDPYQTLSDEDLDSIAQVAKQAGREYIGMFNHAWRLLANVQQQSSMWKWKPDKCKLCCGGDTRAEHCFLGCHKVKRFVESWKQKANLPVDAGMAELCTPPFTDQVVPYMEFIGSVCQCFRSVDVRLRPHVGGCISPTFKTVRFQEEDPPLESELGKEAGQIEHVHANESQEIIERLRAIHEGVMSIIEHSGSPLEAQKSQEVPEEAVARVVQEARPRAAKEAAVRVTEEAGARVAEEAARATARASLRMLRHQRGNIPPERFHDEEVASEDVRLSAADFKQKLQMLYSKQLKPKRPLKKSEPRYWFEHRPNSVGPFTAFVCLDHLDPPVHCKGAPYSKKKDAERSAALQGITYLEKLY
eukprot:TRINITY_DN48295_c0_g1_i1.p1 TRINITY_DN48295_c0_g1~~TRINITY_DN48295_c0_g1_i1.p1  ORF type:complete len:725 (+),score=83.92 TRINITY_DN48295_c0_g1_i1:177-2351(+)